MPSMPVTIEDISNAVIELGLSNKPVCIHSSLRSFGYVDGGAGTVIQGFLNQNCTVVVPTFSSIFAVDPPLDQRPLRNGCGDYSWFNNNIRTENNYIFSDNSNEIDKGMGAIPATVLNAKSRKRGNHPLNSFAAVGPLSEELISGQQPMNVYAPLKSLVQLNGVVLLMGIGLENLTLFHLAEEIAGRKLFRRWAKDSFGLTIQVEVGGCSDGFINFQEIVSPISKNMVIGESIWQMYYAEPILKIAEQAIYHDQSITHCGNSKCERCNDAVSGGPIV